MKETQYEHYYVNEYGEVFSNKSGKLKKMIACVGTTGYLYVRLYHKGVKIKNVHRLVMETYFPEGSHFQVNHINGDKTDNSLANLEWVTCRQNIQHSFANGLNVSGEEHGRAKYSDEILLAALREILSGRSVNSVAKEFLISQSYLNKVKNGVYRKHVYRQAIGESATTNS